MMPCTSWDVNPAPLVPTAENFLEQGHCQGVKKTCQIHVLDLTKEPEKLLHLEQKTRCVTLVVYKLFV